MKRSDSHSDAKAPEEGATPQQEIAYRLDQQQLTAEFGLFALRTHDLDELLQEATRMAAAGLRTEFSKVAEYEPEHNRFRVRAGVGWQPGVVGQATMGADLDSPAGFAFLTGRPVISNHLHEESRFRTPQLLADHGVKRAMNVLIRGDQEPFGVLEVDSRSEGRFAEADLAFLQGFANLLGVAVERQRNDEALRAKEHELSSALEHHEVLSREISHRLKNSLQMVSGLLNMQARASDDELLQHALSEAQTRVHTIAQVHDRLWQQDDVSIVELANYLDELCRHLRAISNGVALTADLAPVSVPTETAIHLGLIVNELVTNAFKYAYPQGGGSVYLAVTVQDSTLRVAVSDRGVGLPAVFEPDAMKSLGMRLATRLARQLGGVFDWQRLAPGSRFVIEIPLPGQPQPGPDA